MSLFLEMEKGWVVSFFSLALVFKLLKMRKEAVGLFFFSSKRRFKKNFLDIAQTSLPQYLLCIICYLKIEISVSWTNIMKDFIQAFLIISALLIKLFGNVLGSHCCFELKQTYPSSSNTMFSSLRKKNHLIMLLLGHLKH